jgi:hypothetical protein
LLVAFQRRLLVYALNTNDKPTNTMTASRTLLVRAGGGGPSSGTVEPPLSQAYGYGVVVGLGFAFALGMILCTWILKR